MKRGKAVKIGVFVLPAVLSAVLAGCVISKSDVKYTGIADYSLAEVECGQTSERRLWELFGKPSEQYETDDGAKIAAYNCTEKKDNHFAVCPFVFIKDEAEREYIVSFEIRDDVVQRYWKGEQPQEQE
ncbi:MAG: hypothetical protein JSU94_17270 [Phycisphaerales bacterium]|nr:MAG: hypothetical protein JSU94_17270 [Phycisphaerales bacterium]